MRFLVGLLRLLIGLPLAAIAVLLALASISLFISDLKQGGFVAGGMALLCLILSKWLLRRRTTAVVYEEESWRDDPATDKQKTFARDLGIKFPRNISKGDLSDLITEKTGK